MWLNEDLDNLIRVHVYVTPWELYMFTLMCDSIRVLFNNCIVSIHASQYEQTVWTNFLWSISQYELISTTTIIKFGLLWNSGRSSYKMRFHNWSFRFNVIVNETITCVRNIRMKGLIIICFYAFIIRNVWLDWIFTKHCRSIRSRR